MSKKNPSPFELKVLELQAFFKGPNLPDILSAYDIKFLFNIFKQMNKHTALTTRQYNQVIVLFNKLIWLGYFKS